MRRGLDGLTTFQRDCYRQMRQEQGDAEIIEQSNEDRLREMQDRWLEDKRNLRSVAQVLSELPLDDWPEPFHKLRDEVREYQADVRRNEMGAAL